jgi:hypothetical protein
MPSLLLNTEYSLFIYIIIVLYTLKTLVVSNNILNYYYFLNTSSSLKDKEHLLKEKVPFSIIAESLKMKDKAVTRGLKKHHTTLDMSMAFVV